MLQLIFSAPFSKRKRNRIYLTNYLLASQHLLLNCLCEYHSTCWVSFSSCLVLFHPSHIHVQFSLPITPTLPQTAPAVKPQTDPVYQHVLVQSVLATLKQHARWTCVVGHVMCRLLTDLAPLSAVEVTRVRLSVLTDKRIHVRVSGIPR